MESRALVYLAGFVVEEWAIDDDWFLSAGEDFAAGQVEGGVLLVGAGIVHETGFRRANTTRPTPVQ
jgi:hypothetical protein